MEKIRIRNEHPRSLVEILELKILKFCDADPDLGSGIFLNLDPGSGMEKFGSGINIADPQHCFFLTHTVKNHWPEVKKMY